MGILFISDSKIESHCKSKAHKVKQIYINIKYYQQITELLFKEQLRYYSSLPYNIRATYIECFIFYSIVKLSGGNDRISYALLLPSKTLLWESLRDAFLRYFL